MNSMKAFRGNFLTAVALFLLSIFCKYAHLTFLSYVLSVAWLLICGNIIYNMTVIKMDEKSEKTPSVKKVKPITKVFFFIQTLLVVSNIFMLIDNHFIHSSLQVSVECASCFAFASYLFFFLVMFSLQE